jgi:hypothetical protein
VLRPTRDSTIIFEAWLPANGWNGHFLGVGNGGFAGSIGYSSLAAAVQGGYAAASTDTGHNVGGTDASWANGHPEKVVLRGDPHRIPRQHVVFRLASIRLRVFAEARMLGPNIQPLSRRTGHDGGRVGPRRMGRAIRLCVGWLREG